MKRLSAVKGNRLFIIMNCLRLSNYPKLSGLVDFNKLLHNILVNRYICKYFITV